MKMKNTEIGLKTTGLIISNFHLYNYLKTKWTGLINPSKKLKRSSIRENYIMTYNGDCRSMES